MHRALIIAPLLMGLNFWLVACSQAELQAWYDGVDSGGAAIATETGFQKQTDDGPSSDTFNMVGSSGVVTEAQMAKLFWLQWPQSADAMVDLLGQPVSRDETRDYYTMPNGHWLVIYYQPTGAAYGFSMGDSQL